jgi:hypothetical protein
VNPSHIYCWSRLAPADGPVCEVLLGSAEAGSENSIRFFEIPADVSLIAGTSDGGGHFVTGFMVDGGLNFLGHTITFLFWFGGFMQGAFGH